MFSDIRFLINFDTAVMQSSSTSSTSSSSWFVVIRDSSAFVLVCNVRKACCTRCYISADVTTVGEALTITSLIVNLHVSASERLRRSEVRRGRGERILRAFTEKNARRTSQKLPHSRATDLAAASARLRALFFAVSKSR